MDRSRAGVTLTWIARILMIVFILFLTMFSLDVFDMEGTLLEQLCGFVMHSIPSFILVAVLLVSWRNPLLTGILALVCAAAFALHWRLRGIVEFATMILPLVVVGILFITAHFVGRKRVPGSSS